MRKIEGKGSGEVDGKLLKGGKEVAKRGNWWEENKKMCEKGGKMWKGSGMKHADGGEKG